MAEPKTTVVAATKRDLKDIAKRDPALAKSSLAAAALVLAGALDSPKNSATSKSMCARALIDTLDRIRDLAPPRMEDDQLDDLSSRRAARISRAAGA